MAADACPRLLAQGLLRAGAVKIDIDAAFRRIPLKPAHRWAAGVAFATMLEVRVHAKAAHWMS